MLKTNSKLFKQKLKSYCYECIASYENDIDEEAKEADKELCKAFWGYYLKATNFKFNQQIYKTPTTLYSFKCFCDWMQGLPYPFAFCPDTIVDLLADWMCETGEEKKAYIAKYKNQESEKTISYFYRLIYNFMLNEKIKYKL